MATRPSPDYLGALMDLMRSLSASLAELEERLRDEAAPELALVRNEESDDA
jgi:hypothetical protein